MRSMDRRFALAALLVTAGASFAKDKPNEPLVCTACPKCFVWKLEEFEETVYEVTYKEEEKTTKRPVIKETKQKVSCKVCKPIAQTDVKEVETPHWERKQSSLQTKVIHHLPTCAADGCEAAGCAADACPPDACPAEACGPQTYEEIVEDVMTCLERTCVTQLVPVLKWHMVPVEHVHEVSYFTRELEDVKIKVSTPVLTPKVIKRKVWRKCPVECQCQTCDACAPAAR
ncbi:MAG: hypothetical protein ACRDD1_21310 [Planctomycetia bacterium]